MPPRIIVRIELTPTAKTKLNDLSDRTGMTQVSLLSRLVEWFANESELVQAAVLGHYPREISADIAKLIMKRMSNKAKPD
jgi:hypothetical protein